MDIHEYQAKEILSKYNVPVLPGSVALKPSEAVTAFDQLGTEKCVVKAQVHSGARGKAGGIKVCSSNEEVEDCLLYTSPSPRDLSTSRMPSSA